MAEERSAVRRERVLWNTGMGLPFGTPGRGVYNEHRRRVALLSTVKVGRTIPQIILVNY